MSLFVKIEDNKVTQVWDTTPPDNEAGWQPAIEVRPALIPNRQAYSDHYFDLTRTPVEIIYNIVDIPVETRKASMKFSAEQQFRKLVKDQSINPATYDAAAVEAARIALAAKLADINAATTHDQLDALTSA